jgi:hypothetical protein
MSYKQGKPDLGDSVHFEMINMKPGMGASVHPLCRNGSFHLFLTHRKVEATCERCLERIKCPR